jgi:TP901 family phage tail tape measure protein
MALNAGTVAAALTLDTSKFDGALKQSRTLMETFRSDGLSMNDKMAALGQTMTSIGKTMTLTLTPAILGMGAKATQQFMSFDDAMRQVRATMNASEEDTEKLTEAAKKYGAETRYTASQSAEALNYLALAGYDADQAITALPTVLRLAQAGGLDLAYASDLVTDSMSALGIEMERLPEFADQLARTSQKSNTNVAQLGEAILTVGGTAKNMAGGTAEMNAELGILADAGIKGAEGGTHLRNVLLSLQNPTTEGAKALEKYTNGVYDAEGRIRSLDDIFTELSTSMETMTDAEKTGILNDLFNKTDLAAAQALLAGCGDRFRELSAEIANSRGAAEDMADIMEGGIGGAMRSLSSAAEGAAIAIGETLAPDVQNAANWLAEAVRWFGSLDEGMRHTIVTAGGLAAAAGPLLIIGGKLVTGLASIGTMLGSLGGLGAVAAGPVGWITAAVAGLAALNQWATRDRSEVTKLKNDLMEANSDGLEAFKRGAESLNQDVEVDVSVTANYQQEASQLYNDIYTWLTDGMPDTPEQKQAVNDKINEYYNNLISEVDLKESEEQQNLKNLLDNGFIDYDTYVTKAAEITANAQTSRAELQALNEEALTFVDTYAGQSTAKVEAAHGVIDELETRTNALLEKMGYAENQLGMTEGETAAAVVKAGATTDEETVGRGFAYERSQYESGVAGIETATQDKIAELRRQETEAVQLADGNAEAIKTAHANAQAKIDEAISGSDAEKRQMQLGLLQNYQEMFQGLAQNYPDEVQPLIDAMSKVNLAQEAADALTADTGTLTFDDLSAGMISNLEQNGIDVAELTKAAMGDPAQMDEAVRGALREVWGNGQIDIASELQSAMEGNALGTAFAGMLDNEMLAGLEGFDLSSVDAMLAMITGNMQDYLGASDEEWSAAGTAWDAALSEGVAAGSGEVTGAADSVAGEATSTASGTLESGGRSAGAAMDSGVASGIRASEGQVVSAATDVANAANNAFRSTLQIHSPSRVFRWNGQMIGEGLALGLKDSSKEVAATLMRMTDTSALKDARTTARRIGGEAARAAAGESSGTAAGGPTYSFNFPNATVKSEEDAVSILKKTTQYTMSVNRGRGR